MTIETRRLSKWYGPVIGVNDLTLTIGPGVTGFLGPNGAGKSTLLGLLAGLLKPSQGTVTIDGHPVWNHPTCLRRIGYCPEVDAFWPGLTGWEFVFGLTRLYGFPKEEAEARTYRALREMDMEAAMRKPIDGYSKGMRQRLKMAQAIAHDPPIFFLDEPLNGMDPIGRQATIRLIRAWGREGRTVVVSSHILHEIEAMTDTILLIHHGRRVAQGSLYEIRALLDAHPLQIAIRCTQVESLAARLVAFEDVVGITFDKQKGEITVQTTHPKAFYRRLPRLIRETGIQIESVWSPDENLQAIFDYLVR